MSSLLTFPNGRIPTFRTALQHFSGSMLVQVVSMILIFGGQIIIARLGGEEAYGTFTQVFNWIGVLMVVAMFGADTLLIKQIPKYLTQGKKEQIPIIYRWANTKILGVSTVLIIGLLGLVNGFSISGLSNNAFYFNGSLIAILLGASMMSHQAYLRAIGKVVLGTTAEKIVKPATMILAIIIFAILGKADEISTYVWANVIAFSCAFLYAWIVYKKYQVHTDGNCGTQDSKQWEAQARQFTLAGLLFMLAGRMDVLFIGGMSGNVSAGYYNVALKYAEIGFLPFYIASQALAPTYSKLIAEKKEQELQALFTLTTRVIFTLTLGVFIAFIFLGKFFLSWFGEAYIVAYPVLIILIIGKLLASAIGPVNTLMMMLGLEKYANYALFTQVSIMGVGLYILLPLLGMQGAAIATCLGLVASQLVMAVYVYRKSRFRAGLFL